MQMKTGISLRSHLHGPKVTLCSQRTVMQLFLKDCWERKKKKKKKREDTEDDNHKYDS